MSVNVNDKSGLVESFTPGYEGCGCGNRRYYTKAEIDEMFQNVLDPEQIEKIVKEVVDEYVTSEEFSQVIISIIGEDYYTKAQIDTILEGYATKAWTTGDTDSRISTAMASETARTEDVYAKKTDVPSLDGYATTGWVDSQNYLKDITITINGDEVHNGSEIIIEGGGGEPVDISGKLDTTAFTQAMESETARTEDSYVKKSYYSLSSSNYRSTITSIGKGTYTRDDKTYDTVKSWSVSPNDGLKETGLYLLFKKLNGESLFGDLNSVPESENILLPTFSDVNTAISAATENLPSKNWVIGHTDLAMATETGRTESTYAKLADFNDFVDYIEDCCDGVNRRLYEINQFLNDLQRQINELASGGTPTPDTGETIVYPVLTAVYNVTSTTEYTQLYTMPSDGSGVYGFEVDDGTVVNQDTGRYKFSTTGKRTVRFNLTSDKIHYSLFSGIKQLESIIIPDDVTGVRGISHGVDGIFRNCTGLKEVSFGCNFEETKCVPFMFSGCTALERVTFGTAENGSKITRLCQDSFSRCTSLSAITCYATTAPILWGNVFSEMSNTTGTLYYPSGSDYSSWFGPYDPLHDDYGKLPSGWTSQAIPNN